MWFQLDVNELSRNPKVYKVDARKIVLKTDFRIALYKLWRSGNPEGIQRILNENDLGIDKTGNDFLETLISSFKSGGYPVYRSGELELITEFQEDNPLILSGKFKREGGKRQGLVIDPGFEQWLFERFPEMSVEDGIKAAGLDPIDIGYNRIRKLSISFEERVQRLCKNTGEAIFDDVELNAEDSNDRSERGKNPYISDISNDLILLSDAFYNEAYLLTSVETDRLFKAYELDPGWFTNRNRMVIQSKLARWEAVELIEVPWSEQILRIQRNRYYLLCMAVAKGFETIRGVMPYLPIEKRRQLARWINELPTDPCGFYTVKRMR